MRCVRATTENLVCKQILGYDLILFAIIPLRPEAQRDIAFELARDGNTKWSPPQFLTCGHQAIGRAVGGQVCDCAREVDVLHVLRSPRMCQIMARIVCSHQLKAHKHLAHVIGVAFGSWVGWVNL